MKNHTKLIELKTLKDLKDSNYQSKTIKEELRQNLISSLKNNEDVFKGIWGYESTVIPELQRAILSKHNINLLGLRGQAKTRIARMMVNLLDEYVPIIKDSVLNDDPFNPISSYGKNLISELKDETPIEWLHRSERYNEKLATPDVSISDLIGDIDPIKAATLKLDYSDERVIHYGLIPRSNRCIFVINELPDLQARIQVSLFNILQEGDIQIRGFKLRMPLDIQFVFTANPEDYTNRGSIVTPLKDRIDSQIITHYPSNISIGRKITEQEANIKTEQSEIYVNPILKDLIEQIAVEARESEYVDRKSGVSARMTISAYENLLSSVELRALKNKEKKSSARIGDLYGSLAAINGKIELVYEGEVEGPTFVARSLISKALRNIFADYFPKTDSKNGNNTYEKIINWFEENNALELENTLSQREYEKKLDSVSGLKDFIEKKLNPKTQEDKYFLMEFLIHGLAEYSVISKTTVDNNFTFKDMMSEIFKEKRVK